MNFRRYLLSSVYRSPDEPAAAEPKVVEVAAVEPVNALDGAAEPEPDAPVVEEPVPEPAPAPAADQHGNKGKTPWYVGRINEETNKRNAEAEARRAAETRAANAEALLERLQAGEKPGDAPAPKPRAEAQPDFETAVQTEAGRREVMRQCDTVASAGFADFPDWAEKTNILGAVNAATHEFVMDVVAVDPANAHKILYDLANDPERAARLVAMDPRRRTVELTRMAMTAAPAAADAKPAPKPAPAAEAPKPASSRAPAPKPSIAPHAAAPEVDPRTPDGNEKMSDAQFEAWYKTTYMKRTG